MGENDRVSVQTYVPASQRAVWREEADEMDMSQAEYVRSLVQAGRRSFDLRDGDTAKSSTPEEPDPRRVDPWGNGLKDRILESLDAAGVADWDELRARVTDDIDDRLETALEELQAEDAIRYSGRRDGYVVVEDES